MSKIFLSYRRADSGATCDRMYERLVGHFGKSAIFKDVDSIAVGANFPQVIQEMLQQCSVELVLIGPEWVTVTDAHGRRRLDKPEDLVRLEVEAGLAREIPVIPVLVQGATMPTAKQLPHSLKRLPSLNAAQVRYDPDFSRDMERLCTTLESWVSPALGASEPGFRYIRIVKQMEIKNDDNATMGEVLELEFAMDTSPSISHTFALKVSEASFRLFSQSGFVFRVTIDGQSVDSLEVRMDIPRRRTPSGVLVPPWVDNQHDGIMRTRTWTINGIEYKAQFRVGVNFHTHVMANQHALFTMASTTERFRDLQLRVGI